LALLLVIQIYRRYIQTTTNSIGKVAMTKNHLMPEIMRFTSIITFVIKGITWGITWETTMDKPRVTG